MKELELKLMVPAKRRAALLKALGLSTASKVLLQAHYFDTEDRLLERSNISLRVRKEGDAWIQTLKLSTQHQATRFEDNVVLASPPPDGAPYPDLSRHSGRRLRATLHKLVGDFNELELHEVYQTEVTRRFITRVLDNDAVEIAFDEGAIRSNGHELQVSELELELKSKSNACQLFELAKELVRKHGLWLSTLSKATRGAQLSMTSQGRPSAVKAEPVRFSPKASAGQQFRAMVDNCLAQICPNASHIAAGSADADQVHQLRVGIRRLRSLLREASPLVGTVPPHWESSLRTTFQALGAYRDQVDVSESIKPKLEAAGAPLAVPAGEDVGVQAMQESVRSIDFQVVLLDCLKFTRVSDRTANVSARKVLVERMNALHRKVLKEGKHFTKLDTDRQHSVRKRMKRLRYISELSSPLFNEKKVGHFLSKLGPAQDALGEHNDGLVALEEFRTSTAKDGRAWFGVGWLTARKSETEAQCEDALKALRKAKSFW
jgi:inorganic triphosphatase YgiF